MLNLDIAQQRLHNQLLSQHPFDNPAEIVQRLGAVQAQDYEGAKWAVAQRTQGLTDAAFEQAFTAGAILRTHVLRPTWHFVTPSDIRWLLMLTAPRVQAALNYQNRKLGLDDALLAQSNALLRKTLQGGQQSTRSELGAILHQAGIATDNPLRLVHILMHAELTGVVCSGARRGKQFTYALLDERAPQAKPLACNEALAELASRYFTSHGPATLKDYVWWSGLTTADAKQGIDLVKQQLNQVVWEGQCYWFDEPIVFPKPSTPTAYLLPNFDEYIVGYTDRSAVYAAQPLEKLDARGNVLFNYTIVIDGAVVGTWKRSVKAGKVVIQHAPFAPFTAPEISAVNAAAQRYGEFLSLPVVLV